MKDNIFPFLQDKVKINVKGRNIERFLKRLITIKVELYEIEQLKYNEVNIIVKKTDYEKIEEVKTIYELSVTNIYGLSKLKNIILKNRYVLLSLFIGLTMLLFLTNTIFNIEVIHNDKDIRNLLKEELSEHGIEKYKFKKNYKQIQKIKTDILNKYKDKIEWLEIEDIGTKYIIRLEERILNNEKKEETNQDIIAKKSAILLEIVAESGEVIKNINEYVKAGDTVISGNIMLYEEVKKQIPAKGKIYGEVWYKATIEYPLHYKEEIETGKKNKVLTFKFLNNRIEIFNFHKYKDKKIKSKNLFKHNLLPINLVVEDQTELHIIDEKYSKKEAVSKAIEKAKGKIEQNLKEKEEIINIKQLKVEENNSIVVVELFFTVKEDITELKKIDPIQPKETEG